MRSRSRRKLLWATIKHEWPIPVSLAIILIIWQLIVQFRLISSFLLPSPLMILKAFETSRVNWFANTLVTLNEILIGFAFGVIAGIGLAILIAFSPLARRMVMPYIVMSQVLPMVALAPIIYILLGFNNTSRYVLVTLISFFPVVIGTVTGLLDVDQNLIHLMKTLGAGSPKIFYKVRFPNSLPHLFDGLRIGITGATIGAVIAEFVSANSGLGFLITTSMANFNPTLSYVAIVILTIVGLLLYGTVELAGRLLMPWLKRR
jgi:NitT/TauT family transport system permease protein